MKNLSNYIDHTLLAQNASLDMIKNLCEEAMEHRFCSVCVNSSYVEDASELLKNSEVKVCAVVGFPLGAMSTKAKAFEAQVAIEDGAEEIDMVINVGWVKSKQFKKVYKDIKALKNECENVILKVIFETALLSKEEIIKLCEICTEIKVDFVKTSTGFSTRGASIEDVQIMKSIVKDNVLIKASGGVRSYERAMEMIEAGASRLGTSSGIAIVNNVESTQGY